MPLRLIRRLAFGSVSAILLLGVAVAASIPIDGLLGRNRIEAVSNVKIPGDGATVRAYVARPPGQGPYPAVLMIHEWWGLNADIVGKADALAREGYVVLAPDTFRGSTTTWIPRAIYQADSARTERVNSDLDAAYEWLAARSDVDRSRIGVVGFRYGGQAAVSYSLHNHALASTVTFYGMATTNTAALRAINGSVLGIYGSADNSVPLEEVREFQAALDMAGIPNQITVYDGQPHASVKSADEIERDLVQQTAWSEMLVFLKETLQVQRASGAWKAPTHLAEHTPVYMANDERAEDHSLPSVLSLAIHSLQGH